MNRIHWSRLIAKLPRRLSINQAARLFPGKKYSTVRYWLKQLRYAHRDGRTLRQIAASRACRVPWSTVDWSLPNAAIARKYRVSRQAVFSMKRRLHIS